jgi:hypothetical protein
MPSGAANESGTASFPSYPRSGKVIADVGCNNGYYMFRMIGHQPEFVLGFEPYVQHYFTFQTLNTFAEQRQPSG